MDSIYKPNIGETETLTWEELMDYLNVELDAEGKIPLAKVYNACMEVLTNPSLSILSLPEAKQNQIMKSALGAMEMIRPSP